MIGKDKGAHKLDESKNVTDQELDKRLAILNVDCASCHKIGQLTTCTCEIPFFKEICLMSFLCPECGYKDSEVKIMGQISEKGKKIVLKASDADDV